MAQHIGANGTHILRDHIATPFSEGEGFRGEGHVDARAWTTTEPDHAGEVGELVLVGLAGGVHDVHDVLLDLLIHVHLAHQLAGVQDVIGAHHFLRLWIATGTYVLSDDQLLLLLARVIQHHLQHEAVGLGLRQWVGPFLFDRVHRGHHEERLWQGIGGGPQGYLPLLHGFEQSALHFGGRPVDLIRQNEVAEDGTLLHAELLVPLAVDQGADKVGGKEVRCELDAAEANVHGLGKCFDGHGLGQPRNTFQQDMPIGEQGHQQFLHHVLLAHDHLAHFLVDEVDEGTGLLDAFVKRADAVGGHRLRGTGNDVFHRVSPVIRPFTGLSIVRPTAVRSRKGAGVTVGLPSDTR